MGNSPSSAPATSAPAAAPSGWDVQTKQLRDDSKSSTGSQCTHSVTVPAHISAIPLAEALCAALPELFLTTSAAKRACRRKGGPFTIYLADGAEGRCSTMVAAEQLGQRLAAPAAAWLGACSSRRSCVRARRPSGL